MNKESKFQLVRKSLIEKRKHEAKSTMRAEKTKTFKWEINKA